MWYTIYQAYIADIFPTRYHKLSTNANTDFGILNHDLDTISEIMFNET